MAKRIFVGGLDYATTNQELAAIFAPTGTVTSTTVATDTHSGHSKCFGFVEMPNDSEADEAIQTLNGTRLGSRTITVNEAKPRVERPRIDTSAGGPYGGGNRGVSFRGGRR